MTVAVLLGLVGTLIGSGGGLYFEETDIAQTGNGHLGLFLGLMPVDHRVTLAHFNHFAAIAAP